MAYAPCAVSRGEHSSSGKNKIVFPFLKYVFFNKSRIDFKLLDLVREHGEIRFKSGAYTLVREHFESNFNKALGQEMTV